ncbi:MAG: hypothetical protein C4326_10960 [Ignavibacteria bacterium]
MNASRHHAKMLGRFARRTMMRFRFTLPTCLPHCEVENSGSIVLHVVQSVRAATCKRLQTTG